jgi:hypothetical protein
LKIEEFGTSFENQIKTILRELKQGGIETISNFSRGAKGNI